MVHHSSTDRSASLRKRAFAQTEHAMMVSIDEAMDKAIAHASGEDMDVAKRLPPHYFQRVALHLLFLKVCGADLETLKGGDPGIARRVLHIGRRIASQWNDRESDYEESIQEREELARGADRAALKIVLRTLIESASASASDSNLRSRISSATEAYLAELAPQSATDKQFVDLTREIVSGLIAMPTKLEDR